MSKTTLAYQPGTYLLCLHHCRGQPPNKLINVTLPLSLTYFYAITDLSLEITKAEHKFSLFQTNISPVFTLSYEPLLRFRLNIGGEVERIIYNNPVRDTFLTVPVDKVQSLYKALRLFDSLLYDPANMVKFKLKPGIHYLHVLHYSCNDIALRGQNRGKCIDLRVRRFHPIIH